MTINDIAGNLADESFGARLPEQNSKRWRWVFQCRRYEEAIQAISRANEIRLWHCLYLASAHAYLGLMDQARAFVGELLRMRSDFRLGQVGVVETFKAPADLIPLVEGLRKAGLPE